MTEPSTFRGRLRRFGRYTIDVGILVLVVLAVVQGVGAVVAHQAETASAIGTLAWARCVLSAGI